MRYEVTATVHDSMIGVTLVHVSNDLHEEIRTTISRQVLDTQEEAVRAALISLGWTPPLAPVVK